MFKVLKHPKIEIDWPVTVALPQDGGNTLNQTFTVRFRRLPDAQYEALSPPAADSAQPLSQILGANAEFFVAIITDWKDVRDEDNQAVPFSPDLLRELVTGVDGPLLSEALFRAFGEMRGGARRKN